MPTCTNVDCQDDIEYLNFNREISGNEYGTESFPLNGNRRDYDDQEISDSGELRYSCPSCDWEFSSEETEQLEAEFLRENPPTRTNPPLLGFRQRTNHTNQPQVEPAVECLHCHHVYNDTLVHEMICPRCNKTWSPPEKDITNITINNPHNNNP